MAGPPVTDEHEVMTEDDVVRIVRAFIETQFPRSCPMCGRRFNTLRDYLLMTTHLDSPIAYDQMDSVDAPMELGPMSFANCPCGTTLSVTSRTMAPTLMVELMNWARGEME